MFGYKSVVSQVGNLKKQNVQLQQEAMQNRADLDFVACMCDVEIPEEDDEEEVE